MPGIYTGISHLTKSVVLCPTADAANLPLDAYLSKEAVIPVRRKEDSTGGPRNAG